MHEVHAPNPGDLHGVSQKTNDIHHGKLYAAYVAKRNEVEAAQQSADDSVLGGANQIYSVWRGMKEGETFAANGMVLHEAFFAVLGGNGDPAGTDVHTAILAQWGTWERFTAELVATGMAARGWAVLAYDPSDGKLHIYAGDAQNHGGVWGATPLLPLDVYEHAYFLDYGSDRKGYLTALLEVVNWQAVDERYQKACR